MNPKRRQREVGRQTMQAVIGTKSQQALQLQREERKTERRQVFVFRVWLYQWASVRNGWCFLRGRGCFHVSGERGVPAGGAGEYPEVLLDGGRSLRRAGRSIRSGMRIL